jgi:hypothetical protein
LVQGAAAVCRQEALQAQILFSAQLHLPVAAAQVFIPQPLQV